MTNQIYAFGPVLGLLAAFFLISRKIPTFWALSLGAVLGGVIGGGGIPGTASAMAEGGLGMVSSILCILASGVLAGALVKTGSAERIAESVLRLLGDKWCLAAISLSVLLLTAGGVFVDIAVITAAPIALTMGREAGKSKAAVLIAMVGGGKAGNLISPNPNTLAAARAFDLDLTAVIGANLIPAIGALMVTIWIAARITGDIVDVQKQNDRSLPCLAAAVSGPCTVLALLALRPLADIALDPILVLPLGGMVCILSTGSWKRAGECILYGLQEVFGVALVLLGTGFLAGILQASAFQADLIHALDTLHIPPVFLAPLSGILMGGAAASTTAGTAIAASTFGPVILEAGVPALSAAAMIHAGAVVLDSLPHGSFFHATAGCVRMDSRERLRLIVPEAIIGLTAVLLSIVCCCVK